MVELYGELGLVGRLLGELGGVVERQVAVDLVGGDVVVADAVLADGLQEAEGALHVGAQEGLGVGDGVVVVALGGVVHDRVVARDDARPAARRRRCRPRRAPRGRRAARRCSRGCRRRSACPGR